MSDRIELRGIRAWGRHGVNPGERDAAQPFDIDLVLELDLSLAGTSDELYDTVDYDALHREVVHAVETASHALIERIAADVAGLALADARVNGVTVTVAKPKVLDGATPSVTLHRTR